MALACIADTSPFCCLFGTLFVMFGCVLSLIMCVCVMYAAIYVCSCVLYMLAVPIVTLSDYYSLICSHDDVIATCKSENRLLLGVFSVTLLLI